MRLPQIEPVTSFRISYRRADVIGLWTVALIATAAVTALIASAAGARMPLVWAVVVPAAACAPGLLDRTWFERLVWLWNGCTRRTASALRRWVLFVTYFTVITIVSRAGSSIGKESASAGWRRLGDNDRALASELTGIISSEHRWAFALKPVVRLLALLDENAAADLPPSTTYTLY